MRKASWIVEVVTLFSVHMEWSGSEQTRKFPWQIGLVTFAAFPQANDTQKWREALQGIVEDPFFDIIELLPFKEETWKEIQPIVARSSKPFFVGLQPMILSNGRNPSALDEEHRKESVNALREGVVRASQMGAKSVALCSGPDPPASNREDAISQLVKSLVEITAWARDSDLFVHLETFDRDHDKKQLIGPLDEAAEVVRQVRRKSQNIGILWDLSHGPLLNEKPSVLRNFKELISHVHIGCAKIVDGSLKDWHPGFYRKGAVNSVNDVVQLLKVLQGIDYKGAISFEVKPESDQESLEVVNAAKGVLYTAFAKLMTENP